MRTQPGKSKRGVTTSSSKSAVATQDKALAGTSNVSPHSTPVSRTGVQSSTARKATNILPAVETTSVVIEAPQVHPKGVVEVKRKPKATQEEVAALRMEGIREPNQKIGRLLLASSRYLEMFRDKVLVLCFRESNVWRAIPTSIEPPLYHCHQDEYQFRKVLDDALKPITRALDEIGIVDYERKEDLCKQDLKWLEKDAWPKRPEWSGIVEDVLLCGRAIHMRSKVAMHKADQRGCLYLELPADMPDWAQLTANKLTSIAFGVMLFTDIKDSDGQFDSFSAKNLRTVLGAIKKCGWDAPISKVEYECRPMKAKTIRDIYHALQAQYRAPSKLEELLK